MDITFTQVVSEEVAACQNSIALACSESNEHRILFGLWLGKQKQNKNCILITLEKKKRIIQHLHGDEPDSKDASKAWYKYHARYGFLQLGSAGYLFSRKTSSNLNATPISM
jgi:hypothetical protein